MRHILYRVEKRKNRKIKQNINKETKLYKEKTTRLIKIAK